MTASAEPRPVPAVPSAPVNLTATATACASGGHVGARARALNATHPMARLRAEGGRIVRTIERRRRHLVARCVRRGPHARVVDVGCEDAWTTEAWASAAREVALVDVDPDVLARAGLARRTGVVTLVAEATDATRLATLGRGRWDVVVLSALLEHLDDPGAALDALAPLLAPGGRFVIYLPADPVILALKRVLAAARAGPLVRGLSLAPAPGHVQAFDRRRIRALLAGRGRLAALAFDPTVLGWLAVLVPLPRDGAR